MTDDRKRPVAERIAALDVQSSFRDIRDGIGGTGRPELTDQDLAAALGIVKTRSGRLAVLALETYYGSHLRHERQLRDAWADQDEHSDMSKSARILSRFAAAIAIRNFAGVRHVDADMAEYSYLMCQRPADFRKQMGATLAWLEDHRCQGLAALRKALDENRVTA